MGISFKPFPGDCFADVCDLQVQVSWGVVGAWAVCHVQEILYSAEPQQSGLLCHLPLITPV
eukprot:NODE_13785_length_239_cov_137.010870.p3 GENE.NODE_13785_length_239_cov_137.010870~~NODE_13785_length_239_cov_137.010870.p3  ORF type:complete len:61 (+),score=3.14 NODE_13785_length_239_cov_137.010870:3-185(+)